MNSTDFMSTLQKAKQIMDTTSNKNYKPSCENIEDLAYKVNNNKTLNVSGKQNGLPKEIYESIMNNPLEFNSKSSILDNINISNTIKASDIKEENNLDYKSNQFISKNQIQAQINIEQIIENTIEKVLNKKLLTENKNSQINTMRMNGNKIQFLMENGDLYSAELKFIKNINKKNVK